MRSFKSVLILILVLAPSYAWAQTPAAPAPVRVEFDEAIRRAVERSPTIAQATTQIARAQQVVRQTRSGVLPSASVSLANTTYNAARGFDGAVTQPQNQVTVLGDVSMPIFAMSQWAAVGQSRDQIEVATRQAADARKNIATATAQAYLAVIAAHRQIDVNQRALEVSRAHLDYATKRLEGGAGSRLNQMRAAQEVSTEEVQLEVAQLALMRAQEALGVLMAENGPVDSASEPVFDIPENITESDWMAARTDVRAQQSIITATERILKDSWRDWTPTASVGFSPQYVTPSGLFLPSSTWRLLVSFSQPIYEGGQRRATKALRGITLDQTRLELNSIEIQARSDVRAAQQALAGRLRALESAQRAATQAVEVVRITTSAYELGATTNIEVIDAQRSARDAESAAVLAEDAVRIARLDLLVALGRFPR